MVEGRDCPLCANIPGVGSARAWTPGPFDQVLDSRPGTVLVPTRGMFVAGQLMLVTTRHVNNFGLLEPNELEAAESFLADSLGRLVKPFGPVLAFEHGSPVDVAEHPWHSCIVHAHIHLIPAPAAVQPILDALAWSPIGRLQDLRSYAQSGYAFLEFDQRKWISAAPRLQGQWVRRMAATALGVADLWDWEAYSGQLELQTTLLTLAALELGNRQQQT